MLLAVRGVGVQLSRDRVAPRLRRVVWQKWDESCELEVDRTLQVVLGSHELEIKADSHPSGSLILAELFQCERSCRRHVDKLVHAQIAVEEQLRLGWSKHVLDEGFGLATKPLAVGQVVGDLAVIESEVAFE